MCRHTKNVGNEKRKENFSCRTLVKRPLGRNIYKMENHIKMDLNERGDKFCADFNRPRVICGDELL